MVKSEFVRNIDVEQKRISERFVEIDDIISRLGRERQLMQERSESLANIRELFVRTEMSLQEISQTSVEISHFGSFDPDEEFNDDQDQPLMTPDDVVTRFASNG